MCYTGLCDWEDLNGECTCSSEKNCCPEFMLKACECGEELKQLCNDDKYHCLGCGKIIEDIETE